MNNLTSILIGAVLILGVGGIVIWQLKGDDDDGMGVPVTDTGATGQTDTSTLGGGSSDDDDDGDEVEFEDGTVESGGTSGGTGTAGGANGTIAASVVAQHSVRTNCWSSINGNVYDLTSWIPKHPGGEQAILQLCGKDGSAKFNGQHGGDSSKQAILTGFKVGVLAR